MSEYRIEFRGSNVGAQRRPGEAATGFAHNFLVLVEIKPDGSARRIAELHGEDRGQLKVERYNEREESRYYRDSENYPKYTLFRGSEKEARAHFARAVSEADWIDGANITYRTFGNNSNAAAHTMARGAGFNVTAQPMDPTGRKPTLPAPAAASTCATNSAVRASRKK